MRVLTRVQHVPPRCFWGGWPCTCEDRSSYPSFSKHRGVCLMALLIEASWSTGQLLQSPVTALWQSSPWEASDRDNCCIPADQVLSSKETPVAITFRRRENLKECFSFPPLLSDTSKSHCGPHHMWWFLWEMIVKSIRTSSQCLCYTDSTWRMEWAELQRYCTAALPAMGALAVLGCGFGFQLMAC